MQGLLVIGGMLIVVIGLYVLTYYLNSNTKVPEGIEPATCSSCNSSDTCSIQKQDVLEIWKTIKKDNK